MSNKYVDLVEIIKQSRENIRPALQGSIFEREMAKTSAITGEEARIKALEELQQRPQVRITDLQQKKREVEEEVKEDEVKEDDEVEEEVKEEEEAKEDVMTEEEKQRLIELTTADISKLKPKLSIKELTKHGIEKRYFKIITDDEGKEKIVIFSKQSEKGSPPNTLIDEVVLDIPLIKGRIPLDINKDDLLKFISLLRNENEKEIFKRKISSYYEQEGLKPLEFKDSSPKKVVESKRQIELTTVDISKVKPKLSLKDVRKKRAGQQYLVIFKKRIKIFTKQSEKGSPANMKKDKVEFEIPLIKGRLPLDTNRDDFDQFISLLEKGEETNKIIERINQPQEGTGFYDPRLLIGAYLAKNNNKQLENLVLNKLLGIN